MGTTPTKDSRIDLRMTEATKSEIATAAELSGVSISSFIQATATQAARAIIEQSRKLELDHETWALFTQAVDAEPKPNSGLKDLMSRKSVFES